MVMRLSWSSFKLHMRWSGLASVKQADEGSVGEVVKSERGTEKALARAGKSAVSLVVAMRNEAERQGWECKVLVEWRLG